MTDTTIRKIQKRPSLLFEKKRRPAISLFAHPLQYGVKFQMENCKIERGIAKMPFTPFLCRNHLTCQESSFVEIS